MDQVDHRVAGFLFGGWISALSHSRNAFIIAVGKQRGVVHPTEDASATVGAVSQILDAALREFCLQKAMCAWLATRLWWWRRWVEAAAQLPSSW